MSNKLDGSRIYGNFMEALGGVFINTNAIETMFLSKDTNCLNTTIYTVKVRMANGKVYSIGVYVCEDDKAECVTKVEKEAQEDMRRFAEMIWTQQNCSQWIYYPPRSSWSTAYDGSEFKIDGHINPYSWQDEMVRRYMSKAVAEMSKEEK